MAKKKVGIVRLVSPTRIVLKLAVDGDGLFVRSAGAGGLLRRGSGIGAELVAGEGLGGKIDAEDLPSPARALWLWESRLLESGVQE